MALNLAELIELVEAQDDRCDEIGPDVVALVRELLALEREEREVSSLRLKLHDRLSSFHNAGTEAREGELSVRRKELHQRIDIVRAELSLLGRTIKPD